MTPTPSARGVSGPGSLNDTTVLRARFRRGQPLPTRAQAERAIAEYIEDFYNARQRHPSLDYQSPMESELKSERTKRDLDRVVFIPRQPRAAIYTLMRKSFAVLVTLRPRKDTSTVPSKLYEGMASGRPVLYQGGGEGARTLRDASGGRVVEPGSGQALCDAMLDCLSDPARAEDEGKAARAYVMERFDRRATAARFAELLEALVAKR